MEKIGFDFINEVAVEYEDSSLDDDSFRKLKEAGFDCSYFYNNGLMDNHDEGDAEYVNYLNEEDYISIFLFFIKVGDPSITYMDLNCAVMDIGGYGLFR